MLEGVADRREGFAIGRRIIDRANSSRPALLRCSTAPFTFGGSGGESATVAGVIGNHDSSRSRTAIAAGP
jgi:hypothetical protein